MPDSYGTYIVKIEEILNKEPLCKDDKVRILKAILELYIPESANDRLQRFHSGN